MERAVMDLPQPDSPTTARVSPLRITKLRWRMAGSSPSSVNSVTQRSSTSRSTSAFLDSAILASISSASSSRSSAFRETLVSDIGSSPLP